MVEEEVTSTKKKVLKKECDTAAATKLGLRKKAPAKRVPMSKAKKSTQETMTFILEQSDDDEAAVRKKKKRARNTNATVLGKPSMREQGEEEEDEPVAPPAKTHKLMSDAMKSANPSKSKPKAPVPAPKRSTRNIPAAEKNKAPSARGSG